MKKKKFNLINHCLTEEQSEQIDEEERKKEESLIGQYDDEKLLEEVIMKGYQCAPEILNILKEELKKRGIDLKKVLLEEYKKSGDVIATFEKVKHFGIAKNVTASNHICIGNLYFTPDYVFYLPVKIEANNTAIGLVGGLVGFLAVTAFSTITAERTKISEKEKELPPLSLLAKFSEGGISIDKKKIDKVVFASSLLGFTFLFKNIDKEKNESFVINKELEKFKQTLRKQKIPLEETKGFLNKLKTTFIK